MQIFTNVLILAIGGLLAVSATMAGDGIDSVVAAGSLTEMDRAHLIFMRSEEKLASDVYLTIADMYPEQPVFFTIATRSEQVHTDKVAEVLRTFKVQDPEPSTLPSVLPPQDQLGVFENYYFGEYFRGKYVDLVDLADDGLLEALYVGATIEELDMLDLNYCNAAFYDYYPEPLPAFPDCGGLAVTGVRALQRTLGHLLAGSENHLCAFVSQIGPIMVDPCYRAQVLEQHEVYEITDPRCTEFIDYVCPPGSQVAQ
jgi:hypothetical protein